MTDDKDKSGQANPNPTEEEQKAIDAKALEEKTAKDLADKTALDEKEAKEKEEAEKNKVPEEYKDFNFGKDVKVDETTVTEFKSVAKEMNLSQEQAQKMVDFQHKIADSHQKASQAQFEKDKETWKAEATKNLGADSKEQMALGAKAMDKFGTPELKSLLADSGLDNRTEIIQLMVSIGKAISEDTFPKGGGTKPEKTSAEIMYPKK